MFRSASWGTELLGFVDFFVLFSEDEPAELKRVLKKVRSHKRPADGLIFAGEGGP